MKTEKVIPIKENKELAVFGTNDKAIAELNEKYKGLVISDTKTFDSVKNARTEMVSIRTSIAKALKAAYQPLDAKKTLLKEEAARLTGLAEPTETELQKTVKAWEDKKALEKAERDRIEQERINGLKSIIEGIRQMADGLQGKSSEIIRGIFETASSIKVDEELFGDFYDEAIYAKKKTLTMINTALEVTTRREEEDAQRIADRAELDRQQEEMDARQKKMDDQQAELDRQSGKVEPEKTLETAVEKVSIEDSDNDGFDDDLIATQQENVAGSESTSPEDLQQPITTIRRELSQYEQGFIDSLNAYAWWKNDVQLVGAKGKTLQQAIDQFLQQQAA